MRNAEPTFSTSAVAGVGIVVDLFDELEGL